MATDIIENRCKLIEVFVLVFMIQVWKHNGSGLKSHFIFIKQCTFSVQKER